MLSIIKPFYHELAVHLNKGETNALCDCALQRIEFIAIGQIVTASKSPLIKNVHSTGGMGSLPGMLESMCWRVVLIEISAENAQRISFIRERQSNARRILLRGRSDADDDDMLDPNYVRYNPWARRASSYNQSSGRAIM